MNVGLFYLQLLLCMDYIRQVIKEKVPDWKDVDAKDILLERMTGITNQIYKVSVPNSTYAPLIYRQLSDASENVFLERESELYVYLHIAQIGLGPKIYYFDDQIRIQQFIESKVLPASCMLQEGYLQEVGFSLSKFHELKPSSEKIKHQSFFKRVFVDGKKGIWQACHKKMAQDIFSESEKQVVELFKKWVSEDELRFIEEITKGPQGEGLVFSHNDLLANNVLIQQATGNFVFIDYEYASYNFPIFDIANYICESEFNYDVQEPPYFALTLLKPEDFHRQVRLIEAYVVGREVSRADFRAKFQSLRKEERFQGEIKRLVGQLPLGMLLHNLFWGWWGIIVCKNPNIKFDYIAFVKRRYDEYHRLKAMLTK